MEPIDEPASVSPWGKLLTPDALRAECVRLRTLCTHRGAEKLPPLPESPATYAAILKGEVKGFEMPRLERLWHSANLIGIKGFPPFVGEPRTAAEAVTALDAMLAALDAPTPPADAVPPAKKDRRGIGGRPRLSKHKANLYEAVLSRRNPGEPPRDLLNRILHDRDITDLAKTVGVKVNGALVKRILDWSKKRSNLADKPKNSE